RRQLQLDIQHVRLPSKKQEANFAERRVRIERQINRIRALQHIHCPAAIQTLLTILHDVDIHGTPLPPPEAERIPLMFPSELPLAFCDKCLLEIELRCCNAQCTASLDQIRHGLLVKRRLYTYKTNNAQKQRSATRSRTLLDHQQRKIDLAAATYRRAWAAKASVVGEDKVRWRRLMVSDVRMLGDEEEEKKQKHRAMKGKQKEARKENKHGEIQGIAGAGSSRATTSWIWMAADGTGDFSADRALCNGIRVEFCKTYA
ncbi:hypothetical protein GYMLUDRAFT_104396, partial [Collybiopsis luxurians FD-317 M1]